MLIQIRDSLNKAIWGTVTIRLEGRVDLESDPLAFIENFKELFSFCNDPSRGRRGTNTISVVIDLTKATFIYPSALIFLIGLHESLKGAAKLSFAIKDKSLIHEYLCNCGFSKLYSTAAIPDGVFHHLVEKSDVIELQVGTHIPDYEASARSFIDMVDKKRQMENHFRGRGQDSVSEILKNIHDHSGASQHYMIGQNYPRSKRVRLVMYDNGVGIKRHMTKIPYGKQHPVFRSLVSHSQFKRMKADGANVAIETASIESVSATKYQRNSGAGLHFLIDDFSRPLDGKVSILSEDGFVSWESGERRVSLQLPLKIQGTLVSITAKGLTDA